MMARWVYTVECGDFWHDYPEERTIQEIAQLLRAELEKVPQELRSDNFEDALYELEFFGDSDDADALDCILEGIYDWADEHRVWIETIRRVEV